MQSAYRPYRSAARRSPTGGTEGGTDGGGHATVGQVLLDRVGPVLRVVGDHLGQAVAPVVAQRAADGHRVRRAPGVQPVPDPVGPLRSTGQQPLEDGVHAERAAPVTSWTTS